ncbi:MAG: glycoside hydrolase family 88 protein [Bacteroidaceae bacterium]|nr:glycoside hydrolase family 88 protein [Bacteroidaceae bacterium]
MKRFLTYSLFVLSALTAVWAQDSYSGSVVTDEGAWCWFADPRALHYENAAGTINATYFGYIDVHGNVKAAQYDWIKGRKTEVLIRSYFQPDDHNNPTFIVLPDERVMIFYTRHTDEAKIWYRISVKPGDITALGEEKYLTTANNTTYPSPFILSDDATHIYLCWRGINWHPTIARLTMPDENDNCAFDFGPKQILQSTGARPYAKYHSNGKDKIFVSYTTGHPDNEMPDWLYFNVIDINNGSPILRDIKGNQLSVINNGVFNVNKTDSYASSYPYTIVDKTANIRNWVWQIALDANGNPVIAYPHIDNNKTSHEYWYARWTGSAWMSTRVCEAGHAFHANWNSTERCYSGGMTLDPDNTGDLYLSIPTKNGAYNKDGIYEIWKYTINDDGTVGNSQQITVNSTKNNSRPFVIPGSKNSEMRLGWMNGDYYYWMVNKNYPKGYPTDIRCHYAWQEELTPEEDDSVNPRTDCICLAMDKTLNLAFEMNQDSYGGPLFSTGEMTYSLDADYYPVLTVGGKTYRSQNRLLTSDNWATGSSGTNGDNHPTKLSTWVLSLTYDGQVLTTYRDGLVDQVIAIEGMQGGTADTYGDEYKHKIVFKSDYYACASPMTVQAMVADIRDRIEAERRSQLPTSLQNGDFEGSYKVMENSGVTSDRAIYVPEGWSINYTSRDENDLSALQAGDLYFNQFFGSFTKPSSHGDRTYWVRQKWGTSTITLSQEMILPEGSYTLTMDLWKSGLGGDAIISVSTEDGATVTAPSMENKEAWQEVSLDFKSDGNAITTVSLSAYHNNNGSEKFIGWDNIVLTKKDDTEPITAESYTFRLRNSLGFDRTDETVEVAIPDGTNPAACTLTDEAGNVIPFEPVGTTAIRFQASVTAGATKGYTIDAGTPLPPTKLTYAAIKSTSREDMAWENDLSAYRMYAAKLLASEPNTAQGVDVWSKKRATPIIDDMYNLSNYHNESEYGVDAYSVNGKRLGCGGVAVVEGGHLVMHDPYNTCTVTANGALASSFTLKYNNVMAGGQSYTETLNVEAEAGRLLNRATVRLDGPAATIRLAVALYQHTDMSHNAEGVAYTEKNGIVGWADNKSEGSVTSPGARFYQGAYIPQLASINPQLSAVETEVIDHHLCLVVDYEVGTDLTFYFGAGWNIFPEGRYSQDDEWFEALSKFSQTVESPLTATSMKTLPVREDVLDIINTVNETWQQRNPNHGDYFWNRAVYHIGNMEAYAATGMQQYRDFSTAWATKNNWWGATGTDKSKWKYANYGEGADYVLFGDNQVCFQTYIDLYNLDEVKDETKIARALEVMDYEISTSNTDYLWWVDGLFMVMPIMTKLYHVTGNQTYLDKMYAYWQYANSIMYDEETGLYFRDAKYVYPAHTTNSGKKDFWARGDGWIFACFAKVLADLPATDSHRSEYLNYYRRLAAALKNCQQEEGYWTRSLLDPAQAPGCETSGTALYTYGFAWGVRNGILDEVEYGQTIERAWNYLTTVALQPDGTVGYIQPIGENASPNTTVKATDYHDFGVGAFLLAASEMSRLAANGTELPKLRMTGATLSGDATRLDVTFNLPPNATEAVKPAYYHLNGQPLNVERIGVQGSVVTIFLAQAIDYGLYTFSVDGLHSSDGGVLAANQQRTLLRTVPLDAPQTGISITAIGSQSGNPHTNVNDGSLDTRWSQEGTNQWIRFDLRGKKCIWAVDVAFYNGNSRVFYFKVQTSDNNSTWTDATGNLTSSGLTNEMERYRFTPVTARFVRLLCSGNSTNNWNSPTEIRIRFEDDETGIGAIENGKLIMDNGQSSTVNEIFDLSGRRMELNHSMPKGLYIVRGAKSYVKYFM